MGTFTIPVAMNFHSLADQIWILLRLSKQVLSDAPKASSKEEMAAVLAGFVSNTVTCISFGLPEMDMKLMSQWQTEAWRLEEHPTDKQFWLVLLIGMWVVGELHLQVETRFSLPTHLYQGLREAHFQNAMPLYKAWEASIQGTPPSLSHQKSAVRWMVGRTPELGLRMALLVVQALWPLRLGSFIFRTRQ